MDSANRKHSGNTYDELLARARESQAEVDRAIDELRQIQRFLSDGPAIIAARKNAAEQAQKALAEAEHKVGNARETMTQKQVEVARLMETAAGCQQALARSLTPGEEVPDLNPPVMPVNVAPTTPSQQDQSAEMSSPTGETPALLNEDYTDLKGPGWGKTYAFPTGQVREPKDEPEKVSDVVAFLSDRDVLCPSCGTALRGVTSPSCHSCRMHLSVDVLKTTGPRGSTKLMWTIRIIATVAVLMSLYLAFSTVTGKPLIGCGRGSMCEKIYASGYAKVMGVPIALLGVMIYSLVAFATMFTNIGQRDRTRQRGWTALSFLGVIVGGSALWFMFVQIVVLRGICPHCLLVDLCGLVIAFLIFKNAPLLREEKLPDDAAGRITINKRSTLTLAGIAVICLGLFIGLHASFKAQATYIPVADSKTEKKKGNGLMMGGLELDPRNQSPKSPDKDSKSNTNTKKTPAKATNSKSDDKSDDGNSNGLLFKPVE